MKTAPLFISLSSFPPFPPSGRLLTQSREFHILAAVRDRYQFDESLFSINGNVIFPNYHAARVFAKKMNDRRDLVKFPEQTVRAGRLNAMGLMDEIYHFILRLYEETANTGVFERAHAYLESRMEPSGLRHTMETFTGLFPPSEVYKKQKSAGEYLGLQTAGRPNLLVSLEESMLLYFANFNPAAANFAELFADAPLSEGTKYQTVIAELEQFFKSEKSFGPANQAIFDLLRAPILAHPESLETQLRYIKEKWGMLLSRKYLDRLLGSIDFLEEENKIAFGGPPPTHVPVYKEKGPHDDLGYGTFEAERFTADLEWMPRVVLLAKNVYVWLDQLSKKYRRSIGRLDEIPDEELDQLSRWNFTGLWLIGLWERSTASKKIKQWTGNPEAVPSAYSLYEYEIARDLGGERAFQNLNHRAWQRGIRLAGDMVPNHMGIFSRWVVEHPEYFVQSDYCPFPNYRFTGGDLSDDPSVQLRIEDGYWSRSDAAVVFQRIDSRTGKTVYIYHGNDGTNMPWNDTAQLDLLRSDVREAVIQSIFHVARKFSIIRFDAAMTLTKKHFQRLWYPQPGTGGDIPSRVDHALSKERFDQLFPVEFWREVVDRVNQYLPNTLLLAEAFWLMEGYFVRTLGIHRVYNSAFMNMLMKEENEKYHQVIKNTLEFNPEILKRYVNFMSNPDERTAIAQFGKEDKYFGVALMMVTLPGLPMFGHGQIEGFTEKYGMEYKRAYYDESADEHLVMRHELEIFSVMRRRHLFSDVTNFELYDFHNSRGHVNHDVFAYSNMANGERALIFYHNKYQETKGWIRRSAPKSVASDGESRQHTTKSLGEALAINPGERFFYMFKDYKSNLEFIRSGKEFHERGMYAELRAFEYHIFLDFQEVYDERGDYERIARELGGKGVRNIRQALIEMRQRPLHDGVRKVLTSEHVRALESRCFGPGKIDPGTFERIGREIGALAQETKGHLHPETDPPLVAKQFWRDIDAVSQLWEETRPPVGGTTRVRRRARRGKIHPRWQLLPMRGSESVTTLFAWCLAESLVGASQNSIALPQVPEAFRKLNLEKPLAEIFSSEGHSKERIHRSLMLIRIVSKHQTILTDASVNNRYLRLEQLLNDYDVREFIRLNLFRETWYYHKESFNELLRWLLLVSVIRDWRTDPESKDPNRLMLEQKTIFVRNIEALSEKSGCKIEQLRSYLLSDG